MNTTGCLPLFLAALLAAVTCAQATPVDDAIAAVLAADQARNVALVAHDLAALERILAPDFNYTHSTGKQETKAAHIKSLVDGLRYTKLETSELRANIITPDVIPLNGTFEQIKGVEGALKPGRFLFLAVWRKSGATWQTTSLQSALPPVSQPIPAVR
jgi:hypothetical protein